MARFDPIASNFSSGEFSKLLIGRVDIAKYANGVDTLENFLIMLQGGITRRPGLRYLAETKDSSICRLLPFQYSADQDYVIAATDQIFKLYSNTGTLIEDTNTDTQTVFLTHANGVDGATTITDEKGKTITVQGTAQLDTAQKKLGSASLLLDGDSDYITVPDSDDWNFGTGDFTFDLWVRFNSVAASQFILSQGSAANKWALHWSQSQNRLFLFSSTDGGGTYLFEGYIPWSPSTNTWYHIAVVRNGTGTSCIKIYIDGAGTVVTKSNGNWNGSFVDAPNELYIGRNSGAADSYFNGWIDEIRISKGIARWTADFTPETTEYSLDPVTVSEISTPYLEADLFEIQHAHKGDLKYLTHGDYASRILSRTSATTFSLDLVDFVRGPFLDTNTTSTTITPSSDTGAAVTLTASANAFHYDAGDGDPDEQLQVGSLWRVKSGVVKITAVNSATEAEGDVQDEPDGTAGDLGTGPGATTDWAEGAFSGYRGYPAVCCFHDGRLYYACTEHEPQKIWGSVLYEYDNFDTDDASDDDAVTFEIATEERVAIRWIASGNKALSIGSTGGTFSAYGASNGPITPSDIQVNRDTNYGSSLLPAKKISSFLFYVQRNLHKIRELSYFYDYDITRASDMTMLAEHILRDGDGVVDWDYQQSPTDRLWCVRDDGEIAVLTRNPEQDVMGWSRIIAGTDSSDETGKFESVCVIPKQNSDDRVWVVVNRTINGTTKRFIEFFMAEDFYDLWDGIYLDCSLTLDSPKTITGATVANPVVITATGHGFSNGDQVRIDGVVGMTELNGEEFLVADKTDDTFELTDLDGVDIDGSAYSAYISGGEVRKMVNNVTGLTHLEGETVQVQVDGDVPTSNSFVVTGGTLVPALTDKAAVIHVGLPYTPYMKTLRPEGGSQVGSAQGKVKRIPKIMARFYKTLACQLGIVSKQDRFTFDAIYTGDKDIPVPMGYEKDSQIVITSDKPLPLTLISLMPKITVGDDT